MGEFEERILKVIFSQFSNDEENDGEGETKIKKRENKLDSSFFRLIDVISSEKIVFKLGLKVRRTFDHFSDTGIIILCPFHKERTPSLLFYPNHSWRCHGCGEGGDIFSFVLLWFNGDVNKTIRWFHRCFGIPLPWKSAKERKLEKSNKK